MTALLLTLLLSQTPAEFEAALRRPVRVDRPPGPLRETAAAVAAPSGVTVQLDPRVDARFEVTPPARPLPLIELLDALAAPAGATARPLGRSVLITPRADRDRIATLAALREDELSGADAIGRLRPFDLVLDTPEATPAELVAMACEKAGLGPPGGEVPADLWRVRLPGVTPAEALAFALVPSGVAFEWDGGRVRLAPLADAYAVTRRHRVPPNVRPADALRTLREALPDAGVAREGRSLRVTGTAGDQDRAAARLRPPPEAAAGATRYTLRVTAQPAAAVVADLARQGVPLTLGEVPEPDRLISLDLKEATLQELAEAVAAELPGTGANATDEGFKVTARP